MINFNNLSMIFGAKVLFTNINLSLAAKQRYAIVGGNGAGKSTLLKLISKLEETTEGEINILGHQSIGFLQQDQFLNEEMRIIDVVIKGKKELWQIVQQRNEIYAKGEFQDDDGYKIAEIEDLFMEHGGYEAEAKAATLLSGLGIEEAKHEKPLKILSGGYKLRVLLAQSLFNNPDILLLDEPTNHLDITTICWLEKYLKMQYNGTLFIVSHDHSFINNIVNCVIDIDYGDIRVYKGNYDNFIKEKILYSQQQETTKKTLESKIERLQGFVDRFRAKSSKAKQAQSRQKMIDKIELPDVQKSSRRPPNFNFNLNLNSSQSQVVLKVKELSHGFDDNFLFESLNFKIKPGEKILIIGQNGVGKSTLVKTLLDIHTPLLGEINWGARCKISYMSQDHHEQIDDKLTVLDWLNQQLPGKNEQECRATLAKMMFCQDEVRKKITNLSGGECARLLFTKMMGEEHNVLVLDEPTNHLDLEAITALAGALKIYKGTVLLVSHDRNFASKIANRILIMHPKKVTDFHGSYDEYIKKFGVDFL